MPHMAPQGPRLVMLHRRADRYWQVLLTGVETQGEMFNRPLTSPQYADDPVNRLSVCWIPLAPMFSVLPGARLLMAADVFRNVSIYLLILYTWAAGLEYY